jgi:hypothetical protein
VDEEPLAIDDHGSDTVLSVPPRNLLHLDRFLCRAAEVELVRTVGGLVFCRAHHSLQSPQEPRSERALRQPMETREAEESGRLEHLTAGAA